MAEQSNSDIDTLKLKFAQNGIDFSNVIENIKTELLWNSLIFELYKDRLIINEEGKIEAIGKKVNENNIPSREKYIDLKGKHIIPGIVDMRVFVGEPGFEYKENFRTLSEASLSGGVTSAVSYTHLTLPTNREV